VASQTSVDYGGVAGRAVDGNPDGVYGNGSVTHSEDSSLNQSLQVNLGTTRPVNQIVLSNRTDCCGDRMSNYRMSVLDASLTEVWGQDFYTTGGSTGSTEMMSPTSGTMGQYVRYSQLGANSAGNRLFSIAEIQVLEMSPVLFSNVALGKPAFQTSTAYDGVAGRAVDGNTNGDYGAGSVTHTADVINGYVPGTPVYWEVDLGGDFSINEIAVGGRTNCCRERLGNFRVSIYDDGVEVWGQDNFVGLASSGTGVPATADTTWSNHEDTGGFMGMGDKVRISLIGNRNNSSDPANAGTLSLAEVRVFGVAVPEPGAVGMLALAGFGLLRRRRREPLGR
jgi:F5/8 type C domain